MGNGDELWPVGVGVSRERDLLSRVGRNTGYKGRLFPFTSGFGAEISSETEQDGVLQSIRVRDSSSQTFLVGRSMGATHSARIDIKLFTELHGTVNLDQLWIGWVCDDPFYGQRPKWVFYAWPNRCAPLNFSQISPSLRSCAGSALGAGSLL